MKLMFRHLTSGLFYARSFKLLPSLPGTIIPFYWQMINLYGTLPATLIVLAVFQLLIVSWAAMLYPILFLWLSFIKVYCIAALLMAVTLSNWVIINMYTNHRAGFKLINLQFSNRTALALMGLLLGQRTVPMPMSCQTTCWDLHFKPYLAGQLRKQSRKEIIAAIRHDYQQAQKLLPDAVFFGCSPGSFKKLLTAAGLEESQFFIMETSIPPEHARIFGVKRPFYFYVIRITQSSTPAA